MWINHCKEVSGCGSSKYLNQIYMTCENINLWGSIQSFIMPCVGAISDEYCA